MFIPGKQFFTVLAMLIITGAIHAEGAGSIQKPSNAAEKKTARSTDSFGTPIEALLNIKATGADVLPALQQAIKNLDAGSEKRANAINSLVDAIIKGPDASALLDKMIPLAEIGGDVGDPEANAGWKWGDSEQRDEIVLVMGQLAVSLQSTDPKRASEIGKAAIMLAALSDFEFEWSGLEEVEFAPEPMKSLLRISDDNFTKLRSIIAERNASRTKMSDELRKADIAIDQITEGKDATVRIDDVRAILGNLDQAFRQGPAQLGYRRHIISTTWSVLNLMKSRKKDDGSTIVRAQLEAWNHDYDDSNIRRWIQQALTREGAPPGKLHFAYERQTDGSYKPMDPNDPRLLDPKKDEQK